MLTPWVKVVFEFAVTSHKLRESIAFIEIRNELTKRDETEDTDGPHSKRLRPDSSKDADQDVGEEATFSICWMETNL
jgi:hypothetical protein